MTNTKDTLTLFSPCLVTGTGTGHDTSKYPKAMIILRYLKAMTYKEVASH